MAGCQPAGRRSNAPAEGGIHVTWTGSSAGDFAAPATARWCAADTLLEIVAVRGDTAIGLSLLPKDSLGPGIYSIYQAKVFFPFRPQAHAAVRWLGQLDLKGFEAIEGQVTVTEGGSQRVSGTLDVRFRLAAGIDSIQVTGGFDRLTVVPAAGSCGRANRPGGG
jgi:hypothetical protein